MNLKKKFPAPKMSLASPFISKCRNGVAKIFALLPSSPQSSEKEKKRAKGSKKPRAANDHHKDDNFFKLRNAITDGKRFASKTFLFSCSAVAHLPGFLLAKKFQTRISSTNFQCRPFFLLRPGCGRSKNYKNNDNDKMARTWKKTAKEEE